MPVEIMKETLTKVVAELCNHVGFEYASLEAVDILVDILHRYMKNLCCMIAKSSDMGKRSTLL